MGEKDGVKEKFHFGLFGVSKGEKVVFLRKIKSG